MKEYLILDSGNIIENIIVCEDEETAAAFGAVPSYDGASIGTAYEPPAPPDPEPTTEDRVAALESENKTLKAENKTIKAQVSAQSEQMDFYEECIAEMASVVYA